MQRRLNRKRGNLRYIVLFSYSEQNIEKGGRKPPLSPSCGHKIYTPELDTIKKLGGNLDDHFEEMLNPTPSRDIVARVQELSKTILKIVPKWWAKTGSRRLCSTGAEVRSVCACLTLRHRTLRRFPGRVTASEKLTPFILL